MLSLSARTKKHILSKAKLDPLTSILESRAIVKGSCNFNYSIHVITILRRKKVAGKRNMTIMSCAKKTFQSYSVDSSPARITQNRLQKVFFWGIVMPCCRTVPSSTATICVQCRYLRETAHALICAEHRWNILAAFTMRHHHPKRGPKQGVPREHWTLLTAMSTYVRPRKAAQGYNTKQNIPPARLGR